jgi:hypothetical protein
MIILAGLSLVLRMSCGTPGGRNKYVPGLARTVWPSIFFLIYPLGLVWPSGWQWHGGEGKYYLQMICGVYAVLGAFYRGGSGALGASKLDRVHSLVERCACRHHGGTVRPLPRSKF